MTDRLTPEELAAIRERHERDEAKSFDVFDPGEGTWEYQMHSDRAALLRQIAALQAERVGWKLVPVKPTQAMCDAGWIDKEDVGPGDIYRAMLSAAPSPPKEPI